jgi:hypothetical protein
VASGRLNRTLTAVAILLGMATAAWTLIPPWFGRHIQLRAGLLTLRPRQLPRGLPGSLPDLMRGQVEVETTVYVRNETWVDVKLEHVKWEVFLRDRRVARGVLADAKTLPSDREEPLELRTLISAPALGLALVDVLRLKGTDLVVEVDATASVFGLGAAQHVRLTGFDLRLDSSTAEQQ